MGVVRNRPKGMPSSKEVTRRAKCLGVDAFNEYWRRRDDLKGQGLTAQEAKERACTELDILKRHEDWRVRTTASELLGKQVPMTPAEVKEVVPSYKAPGVTHAEEVGDVEMSLAEEVAWAWKWAARVSNGEEAPKKFPNEGTLGWFQSAISNRREFEKVVLRVESPSDGDNAYLADGQYHMKELEGQLKEAVRESGERLVELESGFVELLNKEAVNA